MDRPVPNQREMEKEGWRELRTLRRNIAPKVMQTLWFKSS
jgi:hypothetical protein